VLIPAEKVKSSCSGHQDMSSTLVLSSSKIKLLRYRDNLAGLEAW
jgi:hypothetical protein